MKSLSHNFDSLPKSFLWTQALTSRPLFIAFDRDGTLVPICHHPQAAKPALEVISDISELAHMPEITTAIVSARSINNLIADFANGKTILAGNYGLEIRFPDRHDYLHPQAEKYLDDISRLKLELLKLIPKQTGVILDDNVYSLCLHWHLTAPADLVTVRRAIEILKATFNHLHWREQPTSYEILPNVNWTKADALELISKHLLQGRKPELNVYFGDSDHDEHAFSWVNDTSGISVRVGNEQESQANFRVSSPQEVHNFVKDLVALRKSHHLRVFPADSC